MGARYLIIDLRLLKIKKVSYYHKGGTFAYLIGIKGKDEFESFW